MNAQRTSSTVVGSVLLAGLVAWSGAMAHASAADSGLDASPGANGWASVVLDITWCPEGEGRDTATVQLPAVLADYPDAVVVRRGEDEVGRAIVEGTSVTIALDDPLPTGGCVALELEGTAASTGTLALAAVVDGAELEATARVSSPGTRDSQAPALAGSRGGATCGPAGDCVTWVLATPTQVTQPGLLVLEAPSGNAIQCTAVRVSRLKVATPAAATQELLFQTCSATRLELHTTPTAAGELLRVVVPVRAAGDETGARLTWSSGANRATIEGSLRENRGSASVVDVSAPVAGADEPASDEGPQEAAAPLLLRVLVMLGVLLLAVAALLVFRVRRARQRPAGEPNASTLLRADGDEPPAITQTLPGTPARAGEHQHDNTSPPAQDQAAGPTADDPHPEQERTEQMSKRHAPEQRAAESAATAPTTRSVNDQPAADAARPAPSEVSSALSSINELRREAEELRLEAVAVRTRALGDAERVLADAVAAAEQVRAEAAEQAKEQDVEARRQAEEVVAKAEADAVEAQRKAAAAIDAATKAADLTDHDLRRAGRSAAAVEKEIRAELENHRDAYVARLEEEFQQRRAEMEAQVQRHVETVIAEVEEWRDRYTAEVKADWQKRLSDVESVAQNLGDTLHSSGRTLGEALNGLASLRQRIGLEEPSSEAAASIEKA